MMQPMRLSPLLTVVTISLALLLKGPFSSHANDPTKQSAAQHEQAMLAMSEEVERNIAKMPYEHWRDVSSIAVQFRLLSSGHVPFKDPEPSKHVKQLLIVLKNFLTSKSSRKVGSQLILYQKHVIEPCKDWLSATERARSTFGHLRHRYELENPSRELDEFARNMYKADICKYIMDHYRRIQRHLRQDQNEIAEVDQLTGQQQFDSRQCTRESMPEIRIAAEYETSPLKRDRSRYFLSLCAISVQDEVNESVQEISDEHKSDVEDLVQMDQMVDILEDDKLKPLFDSVREFLGDKSHSQTLSRYNLFQRHVVEPCKAWYSAFDMRREIIFTVGLSCYYDLCEEERTKLFEHNKKNSEICGLILKEQKTIEKKLGLKPDGRRLSRCFSCL